MDHDVIVEPWLDRGQAFREHMLHAPDRHRVAPASRAIFAQRREGARARLPAKLPREAQPRRSQDVARGGPDAHVQDVQTRTVRPETVCGQRLRSVRPFQCRGGGATCRPDEAPLGVPAAGDCTDAGRARSAPGGAARPPRVAHDLCPRGPGGARSSRGAQGILDRTAEDLRPWQAVPERQATAAVEEAWGGDELAARRLEVAREGGMARSDGRGPAAQGGPILGRRLAAEAEEPPLGPSLARRDLGVLGSAADVAVRLTQVIGAAGWARSPGGESLGDGAAWIGKGAEAHVPGGRQRLDDAHLREPRDDFAPLLSPHHPAGAQAWVDQHRGARLTDRLAAVLGALTRLRPWTQALCDARTQLIGDVERNRGRIRDQDPWHRGLAVGSGAGEGACTPVMHRRFQRAGMRWQPPGVLHVLVWRLARWNGPFQAFWASRGLVIQTSG